ncbi:helix-turn-helix domain-containing protein [Vagococcus xieshaowenii]|uniref:Mga helix-turn-helix domain-containing protein n=1 Tax=Vagococcus xieshaowenii TaxID=2562451 RepID=A0AAJ5JLG1_9ENTE|nr:helix-turn-helix domain-containing protein [Vagococcus xieshaowenii]QCA28048.1 hypothetical protein E4Z98_01495 [Vagococcus xieshaowenii]TFZ42096.1 hypothetical protein E4031_04000 [Vagococcus xieshaowenii]
MIEKFIDKEDQEKYELVTIIQQYPENEIDLSLLAYELGKSHKKTYELLETIMFDMKELSKEEGLSESLSISLDGKLVKNIRFNSYSFIKYYLMTSLNYEWVMAMYHEKEISLEWWAIKKNMSTSTIYRKWNEMKRFLSQYDIQVRKIKHNYFELKADEAVIRHFYYGLLYKVNHSMVLDDSKKNSVRRYFDKLPADVHHNTINNFELMLVISLKRAKTHSMLTHSDKNLIITSRLHSNVMFKEHYRELFKKYPLSSEVIEQELSFLYYFISVENTYDIKTIISKGSYFAPTLTEDENFKLLNKIIFELHMLFNIKITPEEYFYLVVNGYMMLRRQQLFGKVLQFGLNIEELPDFDKFKLTYDGYQYEESFPIRQLYILIFPFINKVFHDLKMLVNNRFGDGNIANISQRINAISRIPIVFVKHLNERPDVLITDSYTPDDYDIPTFFLSPLPNDSEIISLVKELERIYRKINL